MYFYMKTIEIYQLAVVLLSMAFCISGHIDHAARVMQVITWNKSFRGVPNGDGMKDNFDAEDYETHATVLDKLLAWEKKLYEEVKVHIRLRLELLCFQPSHNVGN